MNLSLNPLRTLAVLFTTVLILTPGCESQRLTIEQIQHHGTELADWFYSGQLDSLLDRVIDENYTTQELVTFRDKVAGQLGEEIEVLTELPHALSVDGELVYGYVRYSRFSGTDRPVNTGFAFDDKGNVYGFEVTTLPVEADTEYLSYRTKTKLRLPFNGEWYTSWGGRTIDQNQHCVAPNQRFAYDFLVKKDGYTFSGDGSSNEDYYCYDLEIVAPGAGEVVFAENTVPENRPQVMPETYGNAVVIDHLNGEYSVLSHFKQGSIVVEVGDTVVAGQLLGKCGNSGHSSEPHLHYHLQDSPDRHAGNGLPAQFNSYEVDGEQVKLGEPQISQVIRYMIQ